MNDNVFIGGVVAAVIPVVMAVGRVLLPPRPTDDDVREVERFLDDMTWQRAVLAKVFPAVAIFTIVPACCYGCYRLVTPLTELHFANRARGGVLLHVPIHVIAGFVAIFLGMIVGSYAFILLARLLLGRRLYRLMTLTDELKARVQLETLFHGMAAVVTSLTLFLWLLLLDYYTLFRRDGIAVNPFFGFGEQAYAYTDIRRLVATSHFVAPNGTEIERPQFYIVFADGRVWRYHEQTDDPVGALPEDLMVAVSKKAGVGIEEIRIIGDLK